MLAVFQAVRPNLEQSQSLLVFGISSGLTHGDKKVHCHYRKHFFWLCNTLQLSDALFTVSTRQLIWITTKHHQMGSFPPSPAGPGRGGEQILIGRCVFLWSRPSRCFSLAGSAVLCILNCSIIRWRSKAQGWRERCEEWERERERKERWSRGDDLSSGLWAEGLMRNQWWSRALFSSRFKIQPQFTKYSDCVKWPCNSTQLHTCIYLPLIKMIIYKNKVRCEVTHWTLYSGEGNAAMWIFV